MPDQESVKTRPCRLKTTAKSGIAKDGIVIGQWDFSHRLWCGTILREF
jgi:hypothetical protein